MALSDRDHAVLREMESALLADTKPSPGSRRSTDRGSRYYLTAAIVLLVAGVMALTIGVRLQDDLGTALGVLGFLLVVGSGWSGIISSARFGGG